MDPKEIKWQRLKKIVFIAFLVAIVASLIIYWVYGENFELENLKYHISEFGIWAPLIFIILFTISTIFIPSTPFMIIGGILFGFKLGFFYSITGGMASAIIVFYIARSLGKSNIEKILENKYLKPLDKYNGRLESGGIWDLIFLRLLPIMPFNVLNILMGVSKINLRNYIIGTLIGFLPNNALTIYLGILAIKLF
ncbi:MAG: TVP38/TMEM64 family protein [Candidatus Zambryskibacteria bacterium]|nr:TVP38/TMEM64 family protein [Candidatus Zambryskibacteria bacterium]